MGHCLNPEQEKKLLLSRRMLLAALGSAAIIPATALTQPASVLPLKTPGLDHLDIIVPDVTAAALFYMGVFNTSLHVQTLRDGMRYFILLGELNDKREAGYIAIGESRGRGNYIGHFCTSVYDWRRDSTSIFESMGNAFESAGLGSFPGSTGFGGIFEDPDGIEIQFLPAPDTLVTAALPSDLVVPHQGLVTPHGIDHVHLLTSNLERAAQYYDILYGAELRREAAGLVYYDFPATNTHLVLEQADYAYGQSPKIAHFGIKVAPFNKKDLEAGLTALGAELLPATNKPGTVRFRDLDGIIIELNPD